MALVEAYSTSSGKKLPYLVPEEHIDHPVLGAKLARLPSQRNDAALDDLKGARLDRALEEADLPKTGTADEKRARLAERLAAPHIPASSTGDGHEPPASGDHQTKENPNAQDHL
jgi:hypothetical protein